MNEREKQLIQALEMLLAEINAHNVSIQHYTKQEIIQPIMMLISQCYDGKPITTCAWCGAPLRTPEKGVAG